MQPFRRPGTLAAYISYRTEPARKQTIVSDFPEEVLTDETGE